MKLILQIKAELFNKLFLIKKKNLLINKQHIFIINLHSTSHTYLKSDLEYINAQNQNLLAKHNLLAG
jgi:hypothetical protein